MSEKILIVDDDEAVLTMLGKVIRSNGMDAVMVSSGERALETLKKDVFDLMLLDINLNGIDGFEVIDRARADNFNLPIIVISARKDESDTLYGLHIGADDYITKPFNPVILGAKVKALIRRSKDASATEPIIRVGPFLYNASTLHLYKNNVEIPLTNKENAIMKIFLDHVNQIFSKEMLYDMVWGDALVDDTSIMVYVNRLRAKIEDDPANPQYIENIRGIGYRFRI